MGEEAKELFSWTEDEVDELFTKKFNPDGNLEKKWVALFKHMVPLVTVFNGKTDDVATTVTSASEAHIYWYMIYAMKEKCINVDPAEKKAKGKPVGDSITQKYGMEFRMLLGQVKQMRGETQTVAGQGYKFRKQWEEQLRVILNREEDTPRKRSGAKKRKRVESVEVPREEDGALCFSGLYSTAATVLNIEV